VSCPTSASAAARPIQARVTKTQSYRSNDTYALANTSATTRIAEAAADAAVTSGSAGKAAHTLSYSSSLPDDKVASVDEGVGVDGADDGGLGSCGSSSCCSQPHRHVCLEK